MSYRFIKVIVEDEEGRWFQITRQGWTSVHDEQGSWDGTIYGYSMPGVVAEVYEDIDFAAVDG